MSDDLWKLGAVDLAAQIRTKTISAKEAVNATLTRVARTNPALNAIVDDCSHDAREEAAELDRILVESGPVGPLHGVPVTVKENIDQKGYANPNGVTALKDVIAPGDSPVVRNLKRAGAIIIGRTNTPEFSMRGTTVNELHGRTYNPWNDWSSSGGSSGGASSAVMAGMGTLAHGNDIAGSLRYPSAATGATSVKPGLGRVPAWNPSQTAERGLVAQLMSVQGVVAREVKDVRAGLQSLIHYDAHDPWMAPMPFDGPPVEGKTKVAFTKKGCGQPLHPAVDKAMDAARDMLLDAGYEVVEPQFPDIEKTAKLAGGCLFGEFKVLVDDAIRTHGSATINSIFDTYYELMPPLEGDDLIRGMAERSHHVRQWQLFLQDYPLLLTPFLPVPTYAWDRDAQGVEGAREVLGGAHWSYGMNFLGIPAGSIASRFDDEIGMPVSIQIVGQRWREDLICNACEEIESRAGIMAKRLWDVMA
ncbi:MAG: amidase [Pseudomonadota bacterium]